MPRASGPGASPGATEQRWHQPLLWAAAGQATRSPLPAALARPWERCSSAWAAGPAGALSPPCWPVRALRSHREPGARAQPSFSSCGSLPDLVQEEVPTLLISTPRPGRRVLPGPAVLTAALSIHPWAFGGPTPSPAVPREEGIVACVAALSSGAGQGHGELWGRGAGGTLLSEGSVSSIRGSGPARCALKGKARWERRAGVLGAQAHGVFGEKRPRDHGSLRMATGNQA